MRDIFPDLPIFLPEKRFYPKVDMRYEALRLPDLAQRQSRAGIGSYSNSTATTWGALGQPVALPASRGASSESRVWLVSHVDNIYNNYDILEIK